MAIFSLFKPSNRYEEMGDGYSEVDQWSTGSRNVQNRSYKERNSFSERVRQVENIRKKYPSKVAIIVERFKKVYEVKLLFGSNCDGFEIIQEKSLPVIEKVKYLVPHDLIMSQLSTIVRNRLSISPASSFFLFTPGGAMVTLTATVTEFYAKYKDEDGYVYIKYASQETFGR